MFQVVCIDSKFDNYIEDLLHHFINCCVRSELLNSTVLLLPLPTLKQSAVLPVEWPLHEVAD